MDIRIIIIVFIFIKIIYCIKVDISNYDIFPLILKSSVIKNNNNYNFLLDTGSPYIWIPGIKNKNHNYYKNVNNLKLIRKNLTASYIGGSEIVFSLYNTSFYVNDISVDDIPLGITTYESSMFNYEKFDGILGLGGFVGNETICKNYIEKMLTYYMYKQNVIKHNLFSLNINIKDKSDIQNKFGGTLYFGEIENIYSNNINWHKIYNYNDINYYWFINLNKIKIIDYINVNDKIQIGSANAFLAFNEHIFNEINEQINKTIFYNNITDSYIINSEKNLKNISFYLNDNIYTLTPDDYSYKDKNIIYSRIIINNNINVLGLPFLKRYYSVYDFYNKRVGFSENI